MDSSMRDGGMPPRTRRWDWYGGGDDWSSDRSVRGSHIGLTDNSSEQVLWECGLVLVVPLACAALVELAMMFSGA